MNPVNLTKPRRDQNRQCMPSRAAIGLSQFDRFRVPSVRLVVPVKDLCQFMVGAVWKTTQAAYRRLVCKFQSHT